MFLRKQFDKQSGIYRSKDSIQNLKIRVSLRTLTTLIKVPKYHHTKTDRNVQPNETADDDEIESHTIRWQQKRFSRKEITFFADKENCQTDAQKEYHQTIKRYELDSDDRSVGKIFTYVSEDSFDSEGGDEKWNEFVQRVNELDDESLGGELVVNRTDGGKERLFKGIFGFETMYIMADLAVETVLFIIRWRLSDGLLIVYPDFNLLGTNPYLQEIDADTKHMFHYALENLSEDGDTNANRMKENIEVISQLRNLSIVSPPTVFQVPPKRCTNVFLFLEIKTAEQFEYDNIHIRYNIVLPNRCEVIEGLVQGSTHSFRRGPGQRQYNVGYCHELMVLCNTDFEWNDNIKVLLDLVSIDGWRRERSEGYTMLSVPVVPGIFHRELPCYQELVDNTLLEKLNRFFIGGRRNVDHKTFNGISTLDKVSKLNRYGNNTISSGTLTITYQMLLQRNEMVGHTSTTRNRLKNSNKHNVTFDDVVSAYHLAKQRLEATTSNK